MATSYIYCLLGVILCCLHQYTVGEMFSFPTGIQYNRGCDLSDPDNLTLEGSVTITPEDFIMFQSKVIIQKTMKLCEVDLTTCSQTVNVTETTLCYCTTNPDNMYNVYVRVQPGTTETGFMLQAVVPSRGVFGSLTELVDIGHIPAKDQHPVNVKGTYQIDKSVVQTLLSVQNTTACTGDVKTFKICFANLESRSKLKVVFDDQTTYTSKSCVEVLKKFDFTSVPVHTMTVSYTQHNRKRCHEGFTININNCQKPTIPEMITLPPTNVTKTKSSEEYNTTIASPQLPKDPSYEENVTVVRPTMENVTVVRPTMENVTVMTPNYVENLTTMKPKLEKVTTLTLNVTSHPAITEQVTESFLPTENTSISMSQNISASTTQANTTPGEGTTTTSAGTATASTTPTSTTTMLTSATTTPTTPTPILPSNVCEKRDGSEARELRSLNGMEVLCDTETSGGNWIVIQRRASDLVNFYGDWDYYDVGFGSLSGNFWFGLRKVYNLCSENGCELRVDLKFKNNSFNATYLDFKLGPPEKNYKLYVVGYQGNAGDALTYANGAMFSTNDRDHDDRYKTNCAAKHHGAWWYHGVGCRKANLNGRWGTYDSTGNMWGVVSGFYNSVSFSEMKIRPRRT